MNAQSKRHTLLIVVSYHHKNTMKVAERIAEVLDAEIRAPEDVDVAKVREVDLVGFGSGIYSARHHDAVLELARRLPPVVDRRAFLFSTSAIITESKVASDHSALRSILEAKGYTIVDEYSCRGFNTNSFLKIFGGMNKGRPSAADLDQARSFAQGLKEKTWDS